MAAVSSNAGSSICQNVASLLSELEQNLKETVLHQRDEWVAIQRVDSREALSDCVRRVSDLFKKVENEEAQNCWSSFMKNWEEKRPLFQLQENLEILVQLTQPILHEPEEEKIDTQGIFQEFENAIRKKDLSKIPDLLTRPETFFLSPGEVVHLLYGAFDAPECFSGLIGYMRHLDEKMLLDLLDFGIEKKKWEGVLFLTSSSAFQSLKLETLFSLSDRLPEDAPENLRTAFQNAVQAQFPD